MFRLARQQGGNKGGRAYAQRWCWATVRNLRQLGVCSWFLAQAARACPSTGIAPSPARLSLHTLRPFVYCPALGGWHGATPVLCFGGLWWTGWIRARTARSPEQATQQKGGKAAARERSNPPTSHEHTVHPPKEWRVGSRRVKIRKRSRRTLQRGSLKLLSQLGPERRVAVEDVLSP